MKKITKTQILMKKELDKSIEGKLLKSEEDYKNNRIRNAKDVFKEWNLKYGV